MSNIRGIGSDRTTFNEKQEVGALKIGILKKNQDLRNAILKRNIGRYEKYDQVMTPAIGEVENVYYNEDKLPTIVGDLLQYTHGYDNAQTELRKTLDKRYGDIFKYYYQTNPTLDSESLPWRGRYTNYMDYVSDVYGIDGYYDGKFTLGDAYNAVVDVLKYTDASYMAKDMAVGVVRNLNIGAAMYGVITTNISNMNGTDTLLGVIANTMYSHTLYNASLVNDSRKREYITPELSFHVGNTWKTIGSLSDLYPILKCNGRTGDVFDDISFKDNLEIDIDDVSAFNEIQLALNNNDSIYTINNFQSGLRYINLNHQYKDTSPYGPYIDNLKYATDLKKDKSINTIGRIFKKLGVTFGGNSIIGGGSEILSKRVIKGYIGEGFEIDRSFHGYTTSLDLNFDFEPKKEDDLLSKTNKLFHDGSIKTLISRYRNSGDTEVDLVQTAVSNFGMSRGRNLLRKDAVLGSSKNPYCRVWTMFHQYSEYEDAIRGNGEFTISKQQDELESYGQRTKKGWQVNSVLNDNNTVQIAPHKDVGIQDVYTKSKAETGTTRGYLKTDANIHKYMFSIENLAWRDSDQFIDSLTPSQRGPNGGRIMWFPPYDLEFTENVNTDWIPHDFIGRGEKIYTYKDTDRSGTLSFTMLIDHPSTIDLWAHENGDKTTDGDEMDLLRYFAGCGKLPISVNMTKEVTSCTIVEDEKIEKKVEEEIKEIKEGEPPIIETPISPISKTLEFYVFFPNNYSGKDFYKKSKSKNNTVVEYKKYSGNTFAVDCDVFNPIDYLLKGNGTIIPEDKNKIIGYEMSNKGLGDAGDYVIKYGEREYVTVNGTRHEAMWNYRVDCDSAHEVLRIGNNYQDTISYGLNSDIDAVKKYASGIMKNTKEEENRYILTLKDINEIIFHEANTLSDELKEIKELLLNDSTTISTFEIKGYASSHGYTEKNKTLAQNRGRTVYNWLKNSILGEIIPNEINIESEECTVNEIDKTNINGASAKASRAVRVYMEFETLPEKAENNTPNGDEFNVSKNGENNTSATNSYDFKDKIESSTTTASKKIKTPQCVTKTVKKSLNETSLAQNEYKYFEDIAKQKTPLFHKITEKIKYFDPAFHSLTPEGFNARLNFLHQCTRQGPTCGASDTRGFSAGNLSFGRPPYCILRVGDFYHTKILIDSISINYGENTWDLNPEGVGVQPMMAKIDISFKFLGGSDLGGPINRLQNAISFNYYANTSVYDDRAKTYVAQEYEEATDTVTKDGKTVNELRKDADGNQMYIKKK